MESSITTDVAYIRQNGVTAKLASSLTTDVASIRKNNVLELASSLTMDIHIRPNGVTAKLAPSLTTDAASIRKNNVHELVSSITTDVSSIRKNDVIENLTLGLETDVVPLNIPDLTLTTNLAPVSSFVLFPITALPFNLHCITDIDFTYHPILCQDHATWNRSILPLLQLLISSVHFKYIFLFSHRHSNYLCPLESLVPLIQSVISSWNISTHYMLSHYLGDNVCCSCSFLYLSHVQLSSPFLMFPQSTPNFPNPASWL